MLNFFKTKKEIKEFYNSIENIKVYNFFKIIDNENVTYLLINEKYHGVDLNDSELEEKLNETFDKILLEYADAVNDKKIIFNYKKRMHILEMETRYLCLFEIHECYRNTKDTRILKILNELGFVYNEKTNIPNLMKRIAKELLKLKHKIKIAKHKLVNKKDSEDEKKKKSNIEDELSSLEVGLSLNYSLDSKQITLAKLISLRKLQDKKVKAFKESTRKRKRNGRS